ncbi:MAG: NAD-dependent epimerase/dehydratase family protein [Pseudomonadales bacterium]|nr:NAD-dependent epimerase/dehydratase family protein [Pseudomonadales bacterium]MBO6595994.1 NAD-dependent epimerase/dehydratase family protein [Pseudomonadales bacterium]MBO6822477.1 NAD-dependent epimerase/dehydratase family protein [Pseudomonadales bacterium]
MTTLVTGAAGFIGAHLCQRLLAQGESVLGIDNLNDYYDVELKKARLSRIHEMSSGTFEFHRVAIDGPTVHSLVLDAKPTKIINLAAQAGVRYSIENPKAYAQSNVEGFVSILEIAKELDADLIYASSSSVYGNSGAIPFNTSERVDKPVSVYAATKVANELLAHVYHHQYGLNVIGLRFFTVYGPWGRPDMSPFIFLGNMLRDEPIKLFHYGKHRRDFTYIDDIVEGIMRIHEAPTNDKQARIYNIGRGEPVGLLDYVETLERLIGKEAKKELLPMQPGDVEETYADVSDLERDFDYRPKTSLEEGLTKFVNWYREFYQV